MRSNDVRRMVFVATAVAMLVALPGAAWADCSWTVRGKIEVRESVTDPAGTQHDRGLKSVQVKVSAATVGRVYNSWGTVYTNSSGEFSISKSKNCSQRHFKVQVKFDHSDLAVKNPSGDEWHVVYETSSKRSSGTLNIGDRTFRDGSGTSDLTEEDSYRRALAWYVVKKVIDRLQSEDSYFDFPGQVHVRYPAAVISNTSYANGIDRSAYIDPTNIGGDRDFIEVCVHEVMHLWNYDHNHGMSNWLAAVWGDSSTHGFQEDPNIAFHEGFAEFAMEELMTEIWGWPKTAYWDRDDMDSRGLTSLSMIEQNDDAVQHALHLLTTEDIYPSDTILRDCPSDPNLTLWDILSVFEAAPGAGYPDEWEVGDADSGLIDFFDRVEDILPNFDQTDEDVYLDIIDPNSTGEPEDACTDRTLVRGPLLPF